MSTGGTPLEVWNGSRATKELHETIRTFTAESARQTRTMIRLTWAIVVLTIVMVCEVTWQIYKGP